MKISEIKTLIENAERKHGPEAQVAIMVRLKRNLCEVTCISQISVMPSPRKDVLERRLEALTDENKALRAEVENTPRNRAYAHGNTTAHTK